MLIEPYEDSKLEMGESHMIAADPDFQRRGTATSLTSHSVDGL